MQTERRPRTSAITRPGPPLEQPPVGIASAARYGTVVTCTTQLGPERRLYVVDERGKLVGRIAPERIDSPVTRGVPRARIIAGDLAVPSDRVITVDFPEEAIRERFRGTAEQHLPVVGAVLHNATLMQRATMRRMGRPLQLL